MVTPKFENLYYYLDTYDIHGYFAFDTNVVSIPNIGELIILPKNVRYSYFVVKERIFDRRKNVVHILLENEDEHIKELISKRYAKLRENGWSEEIMMHMLDEYEKKIFDSGAYERESHRWPHAHYVEKDNKLNLFKTYVKERLQVMDKYVADITR